jgi:hypothetical protein
MNGCEKALSPVFCKSNARTRHFLSKAKSGKMQKFSSVGTELWNEKFSQNNNFINMTDDILTLIIEGGSSEIEGSSKYQREGEDKKI